MKVITVVGARPQFIKAATISRVFRDEHKQVEEILLHSGQHYDQNMSDIFFEEMEIPKPKYNLNVGGGKHGEQTGSMLNGIEKVLLEEKPDCVLVYGDTNSTLAGALAACKIHIPVIHVEAGLRSFNKNMPEEINRILTDHVSELLFTPTQNAYDRLLQEGLSEENIIMSGDVMYDAAIYYSNKAKDNNTILKDLGLKDKNYILSTIHRAETTENVEILVEVVNALILLSDKHQVVLPLHPRTKNRLNELGLLAKLKEKVYLIDPVGYLDMVILEKSSKLILTDSGGVQKEAYFHGVQCVTLRRETEWPELIEANWNRLAPLDSSQKIVELVENRLICEPGEKISVYGSGESSKLIAKTIVDYVKNK